MPGVWTASESIRVCYQERKTKPKLDSKTIERIWREENARRAKPLFNGSVCLLEKIRFRSQAIEIFATFIEYKEYMAYRHLFKQSKMPDAPATLGVTGIVTIGSGGPILLGRRSVSMTAYAGLFETVPAGTVDESAKRNFEIDCTAKLDEEFREETGIDCKKLSGWKPVAVLYDVEENAYDVCCQATLEISISEAKTLLQPTSEYDEFVIADRDRIKKMLAEQSSDISPPTHEILKHL